MPLFEFDCEDCGKISELLVRSDTNVQCAHCNSTRLTKRLSVFSAQTVKLPSCASECPSFSKSGCGGGCGLAR